MAQFHDSPERYLASIRKALPLYDRLHDGLVGATAGLAVSRLLDLGAGTGETTRRCLEAHPGAEAVLLDADPAMLSIASAVLGPSAEPRLARLQDPLPEGPFDLVVSALAVHHLDVEGKADLFRRIKRLLRRRGRFVLADVVIAEPPPIAATPLDPDVDHPERLEDLLLWLGETDMKPKVHWSESDLVVISAERPR
jgi:tRNA (cmo5U34)-methyltransferase